MCGACENSTLPSVDTGRLQRRPTIMELPANDRREQEKERPNSCSLGCQGCAKCHPKMCSASLNAGKCIKVDCKLGHVTGTKQSTTEQRSADATSSRNGQSRNACLD